MKTRVAVALSVVSILAVALAYGQSRSPLGQLDIPFKFMVGKTEMPAGKYEFVSQEQRTQLLLRNLDTGKSRFVFVIERLAETSPLVKHKARVVFDTVGDQKFLSEVWPPDDADGYLVGITKGEEKHEVLTQN
ncbi:MAG: hypothetical protein LAO04_16355 [Acidobacteriia bacterium]|nr:hypothetical protein [Terriglobia bacterium]